MHSKFKSQFININNRSHLPHLPRCRNLIQQDFPDPHRHKRQYRRDKTLESKNKLPRSLRSLSIIIKQFSQQTFRGGRHHYRLSKGHQRKQSEMKNTQKMCFARSYIFLSNLNLLKPFFFLMSNKTKSFQKP